MQASNGPSHDWENRSDKPSWSVEGKPKDDVQVAKDWEDAASSPLKVHNALSPVKHPWIASPESVPNKGSWESQPVAGSVLRTPQWPQ